MQNGDSLVSDIEIFADSSRSVVNTLCKNGYLEMIEKKVERDPFEFKDIERTEKLKLTDEQQSALILFAIQWMTCYFLNSYYLV